MTSAAAFAVGALPTLLATLAWPGARLAEALSAVTIVLLLGLGALAARLGGARPLRGALRVVFWGGVALAVTAGVGRLFDTVVT